MRQLMKTADGVTEAFGHDRSRQPLDKIGPQGFVLALRGIGRREKGLSQIHLARTLTEKCAIQAVSHKIAPDALWRGGNAKIPYLLGKTHILVVCSRDGIPMK